MKLSRRIKETFDKVTRLEVFRQERKKAVKELFDKMVDLEILEKERREYIERAFPCGVKSWPNYQTLDKQLDECIQKEIEGKNAVKKIDSAFNSLSRYSEQHSQYHRLGHFHES
jgi:flagellar biosynthesis chaperone FliJ